MRKEDEMNNKIKDRKKFQNEHREQMRKNQHDSSQTEQCIENEFLNERTCTCINASRQYTE